MIEEITTYLSFIRQSRKPKTYETYSAAMKTFVDVVGNAPLTKETYTKFLKHTTGMNPSTQALYRSAIKGLYLSAADSDPSIQTGFFEQTNRRLALKPGKNLILFDKEGIEKVLDYCETLTDDIEALRDKAFIFLLADSGLRTHEACQLRVGSVDLLECQAVVTGKGSKQAIVHFSNRVADAIREYLQLRNATKAQPLFIRHTKKAGKKIIGVKPGDMWHAVKQRITEAGVDPESIRVHDFRHYFVTFILQSTHNLKLAQTLARHEKIETTGRYAHLMDDTGKEYNDIFNN